MNKSISEYFYTPGEVEGHRCGYCKSRDTNVSQGMWTHRLTVEDYQDLLDRGWRRSGKYCYKPLMSRTCCPMYTISCLATEFSLSGSQKAVLKKMNKYLESGDGGGGKETTAASSGKGGESSECTTSSADDAGASGNTPKVKKPVQPGKGADPSKPPCRKAKQRRQEMKKKKQLSNNPLASEGANRKEDTETGAETKKPKDSTPDFMKVGQDGKKPIEAFLTSPSDKPASHKLEMTLIRSHPASEQFKDTFAESYSLFKKYQMTIHKEAAKDCKQSNFRNFLCDSPLIAQEGRDGWPCGYGSYHQHYRLDGKLVAVGVVDILPKCLSSVYVFYDPDYNFLTLGVYSALRELELTRKLHLADPERFKYYYMGYYIHSCQKMRYKGNYTPSFLLCPESYKFVPIEKCLPKLDASKYSRLNDEELAPENVEDWLGSALVLAGQSYLTYGQFRQMVSSSTLEVEAKVRQYAELVGPQVAARMLLVLDS